MRNVDIDGYASGKKNRKITSSAVQIITRLLCILSILDTHLAKHLNTEVQRFTLRIGNVSGKVSGEQVAWHRTRASQIDRLQRCLVQCLQPVRPVPGQLQTHISDVGACLAAGLRFITEDGVTSGHRTCPTGTTISQGQMIQEAGASTFEIGTIHHGCADSDTSSMGEHRLVMALAILLQDG